MPHLTCRRPAARPTTLRTLVTDRCGRIDPWETLPGYWDDIVSLLGPGVSE